MAHDLAFTGERFVPGVAGEIAHEHWHRYAFARRFAAKRRVLDVACGEGYGSALLGAVASDVVGVDVDPEAIAHATAAYAAQPHVRFVVGSASALPLPDRSVDVVVSFETIEHLPKSDQPRMLDEIARVLRDDGLLVVSAPNPVEYSQARDYRNPFHLHEPSREELDALLAARFAARRWYRQRRYYGSALWSDEGTEGGCEALQGDDSAVEAAALPPAMYFVVVAARAAKALPAGPALSIFSDRAEAELARLDAQATEVLRLDGLLGERDAALDRMSAHVRHLEALVADRDTRLAEAAAARNAATTERDAAVARWTEAASDAASARQAVDALTAEVLRLERAVAAQERIIAYRQSARWWLALPWLRLKLLWQRVTPP